MKDFAGELRARKAAHLYRTQHAFSGPQEPRTIINGREMLLFASNNYLGISSDASVCRAAADALAHYGAGAGGSRLTTGHAELHAQLEVALADFKGAEDALVFGCGYLANVGGIAAVSQEDGVIFSDALNHASIIDGCRMARARVVVYAHNDVDDLREKIGEARPRTGLVVTDGVFSMDGDMARLPELAQICRDSGLMLMVDDAHATGVTGATGRGSLEHFGLTLADVPLVMGTLSKALGSQGGFISAGADVCDYLRNTARTYIFSTALPPASAAAALAALAHVRAHPERVRQLQDNVAYFADLLRDAGLTPISETPIQPVILGEEARARAVSDALAAMGVFVPCIRYPTVKKGAARLRFTLMATHTREDMQEAVQCLSEALRRVGG